MEGSGALVRLEEPRELINLGREGKEEAERWYLGTGASNHMAGSRVAFFELDSSVTGTISSATTL
ncbi:hypothetical protein U9M48_031420 [Paspalum notatum var. saurae]|uniref:Uncharacterized protein n=1 Tax=Paspalum notatum var. saurae TaxID=547442 RepID=A0AAQ3U5T1_PASNO